MPYISTEHVAEIRQELKKQFPHVKFSVRRENYSTVEISIMESPYEWDGQENGRNINHFYPDKYPNAEFLKQVIAIAQRKNGVLVEDGDYGTVPKYYLSLAVGKWDKPHKTVASKNMTAYLVSRSEAKERKYGAEIPSREQLLAAARAAC